MKKNINKYPTLEKDYSKQFLNGIRIPKNFLLDKNGYEIITAKYVTKCKNKFINPNLNYGILDKTNDFEAGRTIIKYKGFLPHRILPMINSGLQIYKITKGENAGSFLLDKKKDKNLLPENMIPIMTVPKNINIAFDKNNKMISLIGRDAIREWKPIKNKNLSLPTRYTRNGITTAEYCKRYRKELEIKQNENKKYKIRN